MCEQVKCHRLQLHEVEAVREIAESARVTAKCTIQLLPASDQDLYGDVDRLRLEENQPRDELAPVREEGNHKVEEVLFELGSLQGCLDATALPLLGACSSLMVARKLLKQNRGRQVANHLRLESLLQFSVSRLVYGIDCFIDDGLTGHPTRLTSVIASACDSLELASKYIVEVLGTSEWRGVIYGASSETARA